MFGACAAKFEHLDRILPLQSHAARSPWTVVLRSKRQ